MSDSSEKVAEILNAPEHAEATPSAPSTDAQAPSTPATSATPPFLEINERTKYLTPDDAKKGFNEAQQRITSLSKWEETIGKQFSNATPEAVAQALNELFEYREKQSAAATQQPSAATVQAATQGDKAAYDSLTPEWKAHIEFLAKNKDVLLDKLGLSGLQETVSSLRTQNAAAQEAALQSARSNGESILNSLLEKEKLSLDDNDRSMLANAIEDQIVRSSRDAQGRIIPNSSEDRFIKGDAAERGRILEEHMKPFLGFGEKYSTSRNAAYVAAKSNAQASQPRTMPSSTGPSSSERPKGPMSAEDRVKRLSAHFDQAGFQK